MAIGEHELWGPALELEQKAGPRHYTAGVSAKQDRVFNMQFIRTQQGQVVNVSRIGRTHRWEP